MRFATLVPLGLLIVALPAGAQTPRPPRFFLGGNFIIAEPQQEFADFIDTSFGGSIHLLWKPDAYGPLGIRFEGGGIGYGSETKRVPLSSTIGGRVTVDLTTSNFIAFAHIGPQLMLPRGAIRPYISPSVGFAYIATVSSVGGVHNGETIAHDTNYDDFMLSYGATGGIYLPLTRGRVPVLLDLSARYYQNGRASYLIEGSIQDNPDGSITYTPIHSRTNLLTFQIGVSVGLAESRNRHHDDD